MIRADEFFEKLASVDFNLRLKALPKGQSFVLAFGLAGIEAGMSNRGNVEITFANNNGIKVSVVAYEKANTPITVCEPKSAGMSLNGNARVHAEVTNDGQILVSVNGKNVCKGTLPISGEGRIGFLQTGSCAAEVSDFKITAYQYYRPENSNIEEDFEEGSLNVSVLMGRTWVGNKTFTFKEYKGNPVLMFESIGQTFLGTQASYSNFEMTFDVPYMRLKPGTDENGEPMDGTGTIGISFGSEKTSVKKDEYKNAIDMITFKQGKVFSFKNEAKYSAENSYWSEEKPFSLQVIVKDCVITVGAKWMNETNYHPILSYEIANRDVTGYVHLWVVDQGNFAIDNLKITNLDHDPQLVEKEFVSGLIEKPEDWVYEPFERVYKQETQDVEEEKTFSWYLMIPTTALAGILILVVTDMVIRTCKKKKKEDVLHEK